MRTFSFFVILGGLVAIANTALGGEIIVKHDGTEIHGEIVGFDHGLYLMRIGGFTKRIAESDVKEIRDGAATMATPTKPLESSTARAVSQQPALPSFGGNPLEMLSSLSQLQSQNPALTKLMELQQQRGVDHPLTPEEVPPELRGQLEQMQNNPGMVQMMGNFKDPAFQKRLLDNLRSMRQAMNPSANLNDDPNMQALEGLLKRLNDPAQSTR